MMMGLSSRAARVPAARTSRPAASERFHRAVSLHNAESRRAHRLRVSAAAASTARAAILEPDAATITMLTILRDPRNLEDLQAFMPDQLPAGPVAPVAVAGMPVLETGPLAGFSGRIDAAARRALPSHLLRRSRILSSLRVGGECLQRVAVTACSGEELVLSWRLKQVELEGSAAVAVAASDETATTSGRDAEPAAASSSSISDISSSSSSSDISSSSSENSPAGPLQTAWQLVSISRDACDDADCRPPPRPHPRLPPERVILGQLAALRRGALHEAARFSVWGRHASSAGWDAQMQEFKSLLRQPDLHACLTHDSVELGAGALPVGQRSFLQEVTLGTGGAAGSERHLRLLYWLNMHGDGCWLIRKFEAR